MNTPPDILHVFSAFARSEMRPAIAAALMQQNIAQSLRDEEERERAADRTYWEPLEKQLEELRRPKA